MECVILFYILILGSSLPILYEPVKWCLIGAYSATNAKKCVS